MTGMGAKRKSRFGPQGFPYRGRHMIRRFRYPENAKLELLNPSIEPSPDRKSDELSRCGGNIRRASDERSRGEVSMPSRAAMTTFYRPRGTTDAVDSRRP